MSYNVQEYEMTALSKVFTFQKKKDLCKLILNKNSADYTLNPVLRPLAFKPWPTIPQFSNQIDAACRCCLILLQYIMHCWIISFTFV